jgi:DNA-binding NarL/FixJ family response regulator
MAHTIKIALYDDNASLRCSISKLIINTPPFELVGAFPDATKVIENCQYRKPDVILMDIEMPGISGIVAAGKLRMSFPEIKTLMLTVFDDNENVFQSICHGAVGYILKKADPIEILDFIKQAHEGGAPMTPTIANKVLEMFRNQAPIREEPIDLNEREKEVLILLTKGFSYKMIAVERKISIDTVRFYIKKIYEKLHVHSMTEAVSMALKNKWV